ncbi:MAG: hypothetical protein NUV80_05795 [Candidatus Berkelbacteria bacterium]|nr:hypothetical protein [Candidatus Berkelbacteria bacterium]MCR4308047.1 hypothetical protein [Candidatus Berkelbacteria bacterium]
MLKLNNLLVTGAIVSLVSLVSLPAQALAAGSITASGGGSYNAGNTFTITVRASGATFDSLQGLISVSGPVSIVSFSAGGATWLPGKSPNNNNQFVGIVSPTSSLTVATVKLKGTKVGSGKVSVSGVRLARSGAEVGTGGGSSSYTITPALAPPGSVSVTSSTHPNQEESYDVPTVELAWSAPGNGATGYSTAFNQSADTTPVAKIGTTDTTAKYADNPVGTYYFHIRANNKDGWSETTHFKINIKPTTDSTLAVPAITSITTAPDATNDIEAGTLTGIVIKGTGPAGYAMMLTFTPDWALPADNYPAPIITEQGTWELTVTDPIKAGFYKLIAVGKKDSTVSPESPAITFEVSIAEGGKIRLVTSDDATAAYKQSQEQTRVAAATARKKMVWGGLAGVVLLAAIVLGTIFRRKLFSGFNKI